MQCICMVTVTSIPLSQLFMCSFGTFLFHQGLSRIRINDLRFKSPCYFFGEIKRESWFESFIEMIRFKIKSMDFWFANHWWFESRFESNFKLIRDSRIRNFWFATSSIFHRKEAHRNSFFQRSRQRPRSCGDVCIHQENSVPLLRSLWKKDFRCTFLCMEEDYSFHVPNGNSDLLLEVYPRVWDWKRTATFILCGVKKCPHGKRYYKRVEENAIEESAME